MQREQTRLPHTSQRLLALLGIAFVAGALATGCAGPSKATEARWARADGGPASDEEIDSAFSACKRSQKADPSTSELQQSVAWGTAVVKCMEQRGYVLVPQQ